MTLRSCALSGKPYSLDRQLSLSPAPDGDVARTVTWTVRLTPSEAAAAARKVVRDRCKSRADWLLGLIRNSA